MADPLSTIAEEIAPAPTNYFDKGQAQTLISRYGNANRSAASSKRLADTAVQNQRLQSDIASEERAAAREERDALLMSRQDIEYGEKKLADETRSGFIKDVMERLDPTKDSFDDDVVGFMKDLPPSILKDQTFMDVVRIKSKQADEAKAARRNTDEIKLRQENNLESIRERAKTNPILANLTPDQLAQIPKDENGQTDMVLAMQKAMENKYANELKVDKAKKENTVDATIKLHDRKSLDARRQDLYDETEKILINDNEAFPSEVERLQRKYSKNGVPAGKAVLEGKPDYKAALEWDKKKFEKEVIAAQKYDDPEKYVAVEGMEDISDVAKNNRRRMWEYAHQNDAKAPAETVTATVTEKEVVTPTPKQTTPAATPKQEPAKPQVPSFKIAGDRIQVTHPNGRVFFAPNTPEMLKKIQGGE